MIEIESHTIEDANTPVVEVVKAQGVLVVRENLSEVRRMRTVLSGNTKTAEVENGVISSEKDPQAEVRLTQIS